MRRSLLRFGLVLSVAAGLAALLSATVLVGTLRAEGLTTAHKKELAEIRKELLRIPALLKRKDVDDAEKILTDSEASLKKIASEAGLKDDDKQISVLQQQIELQKKLVGKQKTSSAPEGPVVSFAKEVAPILSLKCTRCHGDQNPRAGLSVNTFAALKRGGTSGALFESGEPGKSLIVERIKSMGQDRMPQGGLPLSNKEIETISNWIAGGAKYDGPNETTTLAALVRASGGGPKPIKPENVVIAKPTGSETVSFMKDIAPFMVNLCVRCHAGQNPRAGFSLETFEKLMQGGVNGRVLVPGNLDGSRLWDLVGKQDPIKMPPGQLLITRSNHKNLQTWIEEGCKFDGGDAKKTLRELVPTEEELLAAALAKLTPEELATKHMERANELWKRVVNKEEMKLVQSEEFIVAGNVSEARLNEVMKWAETDAKTLRTMFGEKGDQLWKGKLTVFVMKDRFGYEEFNQVVSGRQPPREVTGHSVVTATMEDVYVVLQDVGDNVSSESGGLSLNLKDHMTGAFLKRSGDKLPTWVLRGTGLAVAARGEPMNEYIRALRSQVGDALKVLDKPEDVFSDNQFSPSDIGPVGYTLVEFLLRGGGPKFMTFVNAVQKGTAVPQALQTTYGQNTKTLAIQYGATIGPAKGPAKKK